MLAELGTEISISVQIVRLFWHVFGFASFFSSPKPSGSKGEHIVYPWLGIRMSVRTQFQTSSPLKLLELSKLNFMWSLPCEEGNESLHK